MRRWLRASFFSQSAASWTTSRWAAQSAAASQAHYRRLGLDSSNADSLTEQDIKTAYRRAVLACHPDIVAEEQKRAAEAEFRRVSESYHILMEEQRRRPTAPAAAEAASKTKADASQRAGPSHTSSTGSPRREQRKQAFLRRDADKAFVDAFDGKTVEEILFRERYARRHDDPRRSRSEPTPHADVLKRVMDQAIRKQCEAAQRRYGREAMKTSRLHVYRAPEAPPKGSHIPFVPFRGYKIPDGVTAQEVPSAAGPITSVLDEQVTSVAEPLVEPKPSSVAVELKNPLTRGAVLNRQAKDHGMRMNEGQLYSYHRPF
jgi:curved DNA-binding protein CbpA